MTYILFLLLIKVTTGHARVAYLYPQYGFLFGDMMKIVELPELDVIGFEIDTSVQECQKVLPSLWQKFMSKVSEVKHVVNPGVHWGVCLAGKDCNFRYIAGVEVSEDAIPDGMVLEKVKASKYAVWTHKGLLSDVGKTYEMIMGAIPKAGLKQKTVWLERYDERFKCDSEDSEFDIYVSVE